MSQNPGQMLKMLYKTFEHVCIPALLGLEFSGDQDYDTDGTVCLSVKNRLVPALRSFCSALRVWGAIQMEYDTLIQTETVFHGLETIEELRQLSKTPDKLQILERTMKKWNETVTQIVSESERLRKEMDSNGPQDEVEYWKQRAAKLSLLYDKIRSGEMKFTVFVLQMAKSNALKVWKSLEMKVVYCYNEATDNAAYIDRIDKICHSLYLDNPIKIKGDCQKLMRTVMMIQTSSMFYNTSEKITHLLVKVCLHGWNVKVEKYNIITYNGIFVIQIFVMSDYQSNDSKL